MNRFYKAPLPFRGQKRNWIRKIKELDLFNNKIVIDLFGGSGLLSHNIAEHHAPKQVLWNDFDNYQSRLEMIEETELLRQKIRQYHDGSRRASKEVKERVITLLQEHKEKYGRLDYITCSSWLLFASKYRLTFEELIKETFYIRKMATPLNADGYLKNVTRVKADFREIIKQYAHQKDVVYLCDPPYIMTSQKGYKQSDTFRLADFIELLELIQNKPAILFSSTKSESDALLPLYFKPEQIKRFQYRTSSAPNQRYIELMYLLNI